MSQDQNTPLREDVRLLGEELGSVLREQAGDTLFNTVETIRQVAVESRSAGEMQVDRLHQLLDPSTMTHCWKWPAPSANFSIWLILPNNATGSGYTDNTSASPVIPIQTAVCVRF